MKGLWNTGPVIDQSAIGITGGNTPIVLCRLSTPIGSCSTGSMGNNGALTGITALARAYPKCFMYFPASAIVAGSAAGFYYVEMASTTAGTVYNNTYTTGVPVVPTNKTAFATTGPGAFTGNTTEVGVTITVPSMGLTGMVIAEAMFAHTNSAGTKTARVRFGGSSGSTYVSNGQTTTTGLRGRMRVGNSSSLTQQLGWGEIFNSSSAMVESLTQQSQIDTTSGTTIFASVNPGTATDNHFIESLDVLQYYDGT